MSLQLEPGSDRFVAAVAQHGSVSRVRTRLGKSDLYVPWVNNKSLGALRRLTQLPLGDSNWEGDISDADKKIREAMDVPASEVIDVALRRRPDCYAVFAQDRPELCGFVCGNTRWTFDRNGPGKFRAVAERDRVAWCVETAFEGPSDRPRAAFQKRLMRMHAGGESARPRFASPFPDAGAWYETPVGAAIAVRSERTEFVVMFGTLMPSDTFHMQCEERLPVIRDLSPDVVLSSAIEKFVSMTRLPHVPTHASSWIPSVLGVRLEKVDVVSSVEEIFAESAGTRCVDIQNAAAAFRDTTTAVQARRWILDSHNARARRGEETGCPHRTRLALECSGVSSTLWSLSMALGATYTGPTGGDGVHVLTFPRTDTIVVRACPGGWTAVPRVSLGDAMMVDAAETSVSGSAVEAVLRRMSEVGLSDFWNAVLESPSSEARHRALRDPSDTKLCELVCDCALGVGAWRDGRREFHRHVEATVGIALVKPALHPALCANGLVIRGSRTAMRMSWDGRCSTTFEWFGAASAEASGAPRSGSWGLSLSAGPDVAFRTLDATSLETPAAMIRALGPAGVEHPFPVLVIVRWKSRNDDHRVDVEITESGAPVLSVSIATKL